MKRKNTPTSRRRTTGTTPVLVLDRPLVSTGWLEEPHLLFANDRINTNPKIGIPLYGPNTLGTKRHKAEIHIGFIGTAEAIANGTTFYEECVQGISGKRDPDHRGRDRKGLDPFPGFMTDRGFRARVVTDVGVNVLITRQEEQDTLREKDEYLRFLRFRQILNEKLETITQRDHPLDYVVLVLPKELHKACRVADYYDPKLKLQVHRDLRRAFKADAMRHNIPTQILQETTTGRIGTDRQLDHRSVIAWNLFTGLYFKVDGLPWAPTGLQPSSCHIGISFYRALEDAPSSLRTSVVQAFDENGEGLVLRGHKFEWDEEKHGRSPHLTENDAAGLIDMVLQRYQQERGNLPRRVVIHKSSRFDPAERDGFEQVLRKRVSQYDLVALCPVSDVRLIRKGKNPPLRGTYFRVGDTFFLYTTGYIPDLGEYPHGHVPSPLQIADHVGDTAIEDVLREIMVLTKINWNSAGFAGLMPVTLRFSQLVGEVLREVQSDQKPNPKYKYYI